MHIDGFNFIASSWTDSASHIVLLLVLVSLAIALVVKVSASVLATSKAKPMKGPAILSISPKSLPASRENPMPRPKKKSPLAPELLSDGVIRFLEEAEARRFEMKMDGTENGMIRDQKDRAAEFYRAAALNRKTQANSEGSIGLM